MLSFLFPLLSLLQLPQPGAAPRPAQAVPAFTYSAPKPVNGHLAGVVELGANGLNSFVVRLDQQGRWQLEKAVYGRSYVLDNMADPTATVQQVRQYATQQQAAGVALSAIRVVVSSGAVQAQATAPLLAALRAAGYAAALLTPEQEGQCAVAAVLPARFAQQAFVVDIGSGNTKISWVTTKGHTATATTYGSRFYKAKLTPPATVLADVQAKARQVPAQQRQLCLLLGGAPYQLALATAPEGSSARYVTLPAPTALPATTTAQAQAGQQLYQAIAEATHCPQFVFDREASFAIGYLLVQQRFH